MDETMRLVFADRMPLELDNGLIKSGLSMRDGVIEYTGAELGIQPADKLFKVYRSPATIANAAMRMIGIPLTDGHQEPEGEVVDPKGRVTGTEMVPLADVDMQSTLAVRNAIEILPEYMDIVSDPEGPRELSLGYKADLVPHDVWDFEQLGIGPHHLAAVPVGRCGPVCSFVDHNTREVANMKRKGSKLHQAFTDENGEVNIEEVVAIATELPEALRRMPLDQLRELIPLLQAAVKGADATVVEQGGESVIGESAPVTDEDDPAKKAEAEKKFEDAVAKRAQKFADEAVQRHVNVMERARDFLDSEYTFAGKTTAQIMRDAIATQSTDTFEDSELPLAFKMLRKTTNPAMRNFGDKGAENRWSEFGNREVK